MGNIPGGEVSRAQDQLRTSAAKLKFGPMKPALPVIIDAAKALGGNWGLNGKRGDPKNISGDILAWRIPGDQPQLVDCVQDSGGKNVLTWQELEYPQPSGAVWVDPSNFSVPDPPKPPPPRDPNDPNPPSGGFDPVADDPDSPGMPEYPDGLYDSAIEAGGQVYSAMCENLTSVPTGTQDPTTGEDLFLPEGTVEAIRRGAAVIAACAANLALGIAGNNLPNGKRPVNSSEAGSLQGDLNAGFANVNKPRPPKKPKT